MERYTVELTRWEMGLLIEAMNVYESNLVRNHDEGCISNQKFDLIEKNLTIIATKFGLAAGLKSEEIWD